MSLLSFLKKPSVMIGLGLAGFIGTNILTAKATYKFIKEKEALKRDTTLKEDIVLGAKCYGGAVAAGAVSAGLIFGGSKTYATTQAALVSGYTLLNTKYKNYRDMALKTIGLDNFKEIDKKLAEERQKAENEYKRTHKLPAVSEGCIVVADPFSPKGEEWFCETTMEQYLVAKEEFRRRIAKCESDYDIVTVNEWRELVGFDIYNIPDKELNKIDSKIKLTGEEFGWSRAYIYDCMSKKDENGLWFDIGEDVCFDEQGNQYYYPNFELQPCAGTSHRLQGL